MLTSQASAFSTGGRARASAWPLLLTVTLLKAQAGLTSLLNSIVAVELLLHASFLQVLFLFFIFSFLIFFIFCFLYMYCHFLFVYFLFLFFLNFLIFDFLTCFFHFFDFLIFFILMFFTVFFLVYLFTLAFLYFFWFFTFGQVKGYARDGRSRHQSFDFVKLILRPQKVATPTTTTTTQASIPSVPISFCVTC